MVSTCQLKDKDCQIGKTKKAQLHVVYKKLYKYDIQVKVKGWRMIKHDITQLKKVRMTILIPRQMSKQGLLGRKRGQYI